MIKTKYCPVCNTNLKSSKIIKIKYNLSSFYEKYLQVYYRKNLRILKLLNVKNVFIY